MEKVPFSPDEMVAPVIAQPPMFGMPGRNIWKTPITPKENLLMAMREHEAMYLPNVLDFSFFNTRLIADNMARGEVNDGEGMFTPNPEGEKDVFGITWLYDPVIRGAMEKPGSAIMDDANDWEEVIKFPDAASWDWEGAAKRSEARLAEAGDMWALKATVFTGFYERLISFMEFEEAAVAMIDEDQQDAIHALFDKLADLYITYIDNYAKYFGITTIELHDDWGSQMAPFMAPDIIEDMVIPHLSRVADRVHEHGMQFELHSCGKIERLVPLMIKAGVDMWMGQDINDKAQCIKDYGNKIVIECEVPEFGEGATDDEVREGLESWAADHIIAGKPCALSIYSAARKNPESGIVTDVLYEISRKTYCG